MESNDSLEIPDKEETLDIPGLPSGIYTERERERERDRQTDRQRERERDAYGCVNISFLPYNCYLLYPVHMLVVA